MGICRKNSGEQFAPAARHVIWKFEKPGYGTVLRLTSALVGGGFTGSRSSFQVQITLDEIGETPSGMVRVSPAQYTKTLYIPGYEGMPELALNDYWIDQYEVT